MIDFLKYRSWALCLFAAMAVSFIGLLVYGRYTRGQAFRYSIEFTGGTQILLGTSQLVEAGKASGALEALQVSCTVRQLSGHELLVRVQRFDEDTAGIAAEVKEKLEQAMPDVKFEILQVEGIGAGVGSEMWFSLLRAVIICLAAMLLYIFSRFFSLSYAIGAVGALLHDAMVIGLVCLVFGYEISPNIIMAILVVLGYSINDTIIIFARIRENNGLLRGKSFYDIVNISINETMRRTILTTLSTLLVVVALLVFGGAQFRSCAAMLLIGFLFGTYSSIYVASPLMMACRKKLSGNSSTAAA